MNRWLDSLSEDWVSQPRSPLSEHTRRSSSALSVASQTSNASQSRIPRFKPRAGSNLASASASSAKRPSPGPTDSSRKNVLKERSSSNLNVPRHRDSESAYHSGSPSAKKPTGSKRNTTATSVPSVAQDTVQYRNLKSSPTKENEAGSTPDWKRRVLQGKVGGTGPDLFGPIGLESIFKPPTVGRASKVLDKQKRGRKYQPVQVDEFPSSPPAFPSDLASVERSGGTTDRRRLSLLKQMEILEEVSEGDSRNSLPKASNPEIEEAEDTSQIINFVTPDSELAEDDHNEVLSQVLLPKKHEKHRNDWLKADQLSTDQSQGPAGAPNLRSSGQKSPECNKEDQGNGAIPSPVPENLAARLSDWTNHSLPDDLSTGTDLYAANGGFINVRRGGYSNEGSFHRRPLSPSSLPDFDAPELRSPSPARHRFSNRSRKSSIPEELNNQPRSAPITPRRKQEKSPGSLDEPRSSGSPLKLFDKYDTFTNERLIRRISKFERSVHESEEEQSEQESQPKSSVRSTKELTPPRHCPPEGLATKRSSRRIDSFGAGQLDSYSFEAEHKYDPEARPASHVRKDHSATDLPNDNFRFHTFIDKHQDTEHINIQIEATETVNGKRLPLSPVKGSRAKRRRTLRSSEELKLEIHQYAKPTQVSSVRHAENNVDKDTQFQVASSPSSVGKSLAGTKRKDARYDSDSQAADPKVLALRQMLRPRTPTPSQRGSQQEFSTQRDHGAERLNVDQPDRAESVSMDLDHQTQTLAGELATFTLNMAQDMTQGARKPSVTTADFFNEAKQIMQLIRKQGRPQSSQAISEEEEEEEEEPESGSDERLQAQLEQSTIDEFSRPPSREGARLRQLREPAKVDARVVSHLRKFEDTDDLGLALPSSVKSMHINQSHDPTPSPDKSAEGVFQRSGSEPQSDPPNIRIRTQMQGQTKVGGVRSEQNGPQTATRTSVQSTTSESSNSSTNRSVPTGSSRGSRGSGTKAVIAPQVVSHLLSDNVGAMTFDHSKQVWVKRKSSQKPQSRGSHSRTGSDVTEDLFKDIPDLTVDEHQEHQCTLTNVTSIKVLGSASDQISSHDHGVEHPDANLSSRPQTTESAATETVDQSSAPSKFSRFGSSGPVPGTRATSWGDEILTQKVVQTQTHSHNGNRKGNRDTHSEEVEHEISILEGRTSEIPHHGHHSQRQPRVVTVAFSSPLVDQVQILNDDVDAAASWDDESDLDLADSPVRDDARSLSASQRRTSSGFRKTSSYRNASRRASIGFARPMSRVDENEELTFLQAFQGPHNASKELIVTTPLPASHNAPLPSALSSAQASSIGFQLSPLSEFTVHKSEKLETRDGRHVARHRGLLATHEVEGPLSLAIQDLVKKLTDVEPYEPYWDHIRHLDLRNRKLQTLHMLDEYCAQVEDLDVSHNEISQLHGAPRWIRHMKARHNSLSDLTSWAHLRNLQYLDITGNQIQSLIGFQNLVHLRELRADDNQIEGLEGILELDGLIRLRLRGNRIKVINFEACNLVRLTDLDLRQNELVEVRGLARLPGLKHLDLSNNKLEKLSPLGAMPSLQDLRLANNQLHTIDMGEFPNLQQLDIDKNSVAEISNLSSHRYLEVLSWREQRLDGVPHESSVQYQHCRNVRELYLSGNSLSTFDPEGHLLNLQHLELASTGLQSLGGNFGIKCSNLRVLNLNFNALSELRPLLGIVKLEKLHLAGNRISRLRRTGSVLERIGAELTELDLRQNPVTLGYYIGQQPQQILDKQQLILASNSEGSDDPDDSFNNLRNQISYQLPPLETTVDDAARQRLDEDTKMRRLDGLDLDRRKIASKDGVWERLRELGVITDKAGKDACELEG
ncbi:MAG: hypothetical protein Q9216_001321 [Gyalolechia sp. 2 TL-2023]